MKKKVFMSAILFALYIFLPGITQQIFMTYDDYYSYVIIVMFFIINILFAFNVFNLSNFYNFSVAAFVTTIGILSVQIVRCLHLGFQGITIAIFCNAISSILAWSMVFQLKKKYVNSKL